MPHKKASSNERTIVHLPSRESLWSNLGYFLFNHLVTLLRYPHPHPLPHYPHCLLAISNPCLLKTISHNHLILKLMHLKSCCEFCIRLTFSVHYQDIIKDWWMERMDVRTMYIATSLLAVWPDLAIFLLLWQNIKSVRQTFYVLLSIWPKF